jgi:hypothetical protein
LPRAELVSRAALGLVATVWIAGGWIEERAAEVWSVPATREPAIAEVAPGFARLCRAAASALPADAVVGVALPDRLPTFEPGYYVQQAAYLLAPRRVVPAGPGSLPTTHLLLYRVPPPEGAPVLLRCGQEGVVLGLAR